MITRLRERLLAAFVPGYGRYVQAKRLHEGSPNGLFPQTYFHLLTDEQKRAARACPMLARAESLYRECLETEGSPKKPFNQAVVHHQLGMLFHRQDRLAEARAEYQAALRVFENLPDAAAPGSVSSCHFRLGELALAEGDAASARPHLTKSRDLDRFLGDEEGAKLGQSLLDRLETCCGRDHRSTR